VAISTVAKLSHILEYLGAASAIDAQHGQTARLRDLRDLADADMQTASHNRPAQKLRDEICRARLVDLKGNGLAYRLAQC
jgi:hypothetical protein